MHYRSEYACERETHKKEKSTIFLYEFISLLPMGC